MQSQLTTIGIGKFTIADEALVNEADLGVNFFLDKDSLGKSRAEQCVKLLQELNPDVNGDWYPKLKVHQQTCLPTNIYAKQNMYVGWQNRSSLRIRPTRKIYI